jgi:hypothetical protein
MITFSGRMPIQPSLDEVWTLLALIDTVVPYMSALTISSAPDPSRPTTLPLIRFERPRKFATKVVMGLVYSWYGEPICSIEPLFITATVSAMVMASSWSCVTCTNVMPTSD